MISRAILLAFDFDGTLAPIREDPTSVQMGRAATTLLSETTDIPGVVVAVVSGRDVEDLAARTRTPGAYLVGSHGLDIHGPGGVVVRDTPPLDVALAEPLRSEILAKGLRIERKKHALALHWRGVSSDAIGPVTDQFRSWAREQGLDLVEGRCVVEARAAGGGKEEALRWLSHSIGASRVIYAGDDITDFGALRFASENGRGLFMASAERNPPPGVTVVSSFRELFRLVREEVMI